MHSSNQMKSNYKKTKPTLKYVITMLGKQTLVELRDKIKCLSDLTIPVETSDNPNQPYQPMAKVNFPNLLCLNFVPNMVLFFFFFF